MLALISKRTKTHYLVRWDVRSISFLERLLPDRGFDLLAKLSSFRDT